MDTKEEPSSAPVALKEGNRKRHEAKVTRKGARQEPRSDPTGGRLMFRDLDSLSDEQLRKLTKANTRKNHGGRSSRLRSQVERVFRRLDNLAADVKLQPRYTIEALPIVSSDEAATVVRDRQTASPQCGLAAAKDGQGHQVPLKTENREQRALQPTGPSPEAKVSNGSEQKLDTILLDNDEFEIEPATSNSAFKELESPNSLGVQSGSARCVRISTSVTVLGYLPLQHVSVSKLQRYEHPTRTGKCLQTRKAIEDELKFPRAMQRMDKIREGESQGNERGIERTTSALENVNRGNNRPCPPPPRRVRSTGAIPIEHIAPTLPEAEKSRKNSN